MSRGRRTANSYNSYNNNKGKEPPSKGTDNKFELLAQLGGALPVVVEPPTRREPRQRQASPPGEHSKRAPKAKPRDTKDAQEKEEGNGEPVVTFEESVHGLDAFLLSHIFGFLQDGPALARLRLVCTRWREIIDEDRRLWKNLFQRDFAERRHGKGRAKRRRNITDYQQHYIQLYRERYKVLRAQKLERQQLVVKVSRLLRVVVPRLYERQRSYDADPRHPWKQCVHPGDSLQLADKQNVGMWCECRACRAVLAIRDPDQWRTYYPRVLDLTFHCQENLHRLQPFASSVQLVLVKDGVDLEAAAYRHYADYMDHALALADG